MKLPKHIEIFIGYDINSDSMAPTIVIDGVSTQHKSEYSTLTMEELSYKLCRLVKSMPEYKS